MILRKKKKPVNHLYPYLKSINEGRISEEEIDLFQDMDESKESLQKKRLVLFKLHSKLNEELIPLVKHTKALYDEYQTTKQGHDKLLEEMNKFMLFNTKVYKVSDVLSNIDLLLKYKYNIEN